jgi:cytochrome c oxidase assembly protein subunit 11
MSKRNRRTGWLMGLIALAMVGLSFAAVPLYRIFCQVTGFGGTTMRVDEAQAATVQPVAGKSISIRFDGNVSRELAWEFKPTESHRTVQIGARNMSVYTAKSLSTLPLTGSATFNVTPEQAGQYFHKVQCFCFTEQTLRPGQQVQMPVVFYVDPRILDDPDTRDISEITLSYTFYPVEQPGAGS